MDDKVIVQVECNYQAASVLMPILKVCEMMSDLGMANYCCFFVDGDTLKFKNVRSGESKVIERPVQQAAAGFAYNINGTVYKRFPDNHIYFVDHGTGKVEDATPLKKWSYCGRRFDMDNDFVDQNS